MPHKSKNPVSEMIKLAFNALDLPSQRVIIGDLIDGYFSNAKKTIAASMTSGAQ
jgi:hypothetical protein